MSISLVPVAATIAIMYVVQGSIVGLADSTLPQLLNRNQDSLAASEILAIVKLPAAMKILFAPLTDYLSQRVPGSYTGFVVMLQVLAGAILFQLAPKMSLVGSLGGEQAAAELRWPLFGAACANSLSDLALDAFALQQMPERFQHIPALCQVVGIFLGKTLAKSGLFLLADREMISLPGFAGTEEAVEALGLAAVLRKSWSFATERRNMPHWLLYQLAMPTMYFHAVAVLANRYEQFGFKGEDYAAYDIPLAGVTVVLLASVSRMAADAARPLAFFMRLYVVQVALVCAMMWQYVSWSGTATTTFTVTYAVLNKFQDFLFFVFELGEFAFYGRVASLDPALVATLMTLQTCAFNFAEFFHCWLAPVLVDGLSRCARAGGQFGCTYDAYPLVGLSLTAVGLLFLATQWQRIHAYQDLKDPGWSPNTPRARDQVLVALMAVGISGFTAREILY